MIHHAAEALTSETATEIQWTGPSMRATGKPAVCRSISMLATIKLVPKCKTDARTGTTTAVAIQKITLLLGTGG
jgi:hypothetical protein